MNLSDPNRPTPARRPSVGRRSLARGCLLIAALAGAQIVHADGSCGRPPGASQSEWFVSWENDAISPLRENTDQFYTQGIRFGYQFATGDEPKPLQGVEDWLCGRLPPARSAGPSGRGVTANVFIGQHLFTPGTIRVPTLIADDRPYAAWLYAGVGVSATQVWEADGADVRDWHASIRYLEIQAGTVGPRAQGEWAQREFHELLPNAKPPLGWDTQIPNEWGAYVRYRHMERRPLGRLEVFGEEIETDIVPYAEAALGNVQTYAEAGVDFRIGRNIGPPFAPRLGPALERGLIPERTSDPSSADAISSGMPTAGGRGPDCVSGLGWFTLRECTLFVGVSGRGVVRNIFLDGTWSGPSHSVDKEPFYYDVSAGFRLRWDAFQLETYFVRRSREFSPVPATSARRDGVQQFGGVNMQCFGAGSWFCPTFFTLLTAVVAAQ